jgi:branched-chain amino acid transport system substrate-binding protein
MARRFVLLGLIAAFALAAYVAPGMGAKALDPGVTPKLITVGATYPITGAVGSVYGTITRAVGAYNAYFNASSDSINGRKIKTIYIDDQYDPSQTVKGTKQLVEQDHVFAIVGSLGTAPNEAIQGYLNSRKVPQVLIATGDAFWSLPCAKPAANGTLPNNVPTSCPATKNQTGHYWTFGGLGTYAGEAKLMAGWLNQNVKGGKIGVLYQNDAYGVPYLAALKRYLGKNNKIVSAQPYSATPGATTDTTQQVIALHRAGADVLYNMALPLQSISALVAAGKIGWKPRQIVVNAVAAAQPFMQAAAKQGAPIDGAITSGIGPNPNDPSNQGLPAVKLYKQIMNKYFQLQGSQTMAQAIADQNNYAGVAGAYLTIRILKQSGKTPTRAGLMNALTHLNITDDPFLFKGYKVHTTPTFRFLYPEAKVERWSDLLDHVVSA